MNLSGYPDFYHLGIPSSTGHACNAFQTTDKGLVYIDDTGVQAGLQHPPNMDKTVNIVVGQAYIPISLFPNGNWNTAWDSMGVVTDVQVNW